MLNSISHMGQAIKITGMVKPIRIFKYVLKNAGIIKYGKECEAAVTVIHCW